MKRMSEVLSLPLAISECFLVEETGNRCAEFDFEVEAQHAAHAINHVDALADALEVCSKIIGALPGQDIEVLRAYHQAFEALKAYRGEK